MQIKNYPVVIINNAIQEAEKTDKISLPTIDEAFSSLHLKVGDKVIVSQLSDYDIAEILSELQEGIYSSNDSYYEVTSKKTKQNVITYIKRLSNFTLHLKNKVIVRNYNNKDTVIHMNELIVNIDGKKHYVTFSNSELSNIRRLEEKLTEYGNIINVINDTQLKETVAKTLSEKADIVTEYKTAGYNLYDRHAIFVTKHKTYIYGNAVNELPHIRLSDQAILEPIFCNYSDLQNDTELAIIADTLEIQQSEKAFVSAILNKLFNTLELAYNSQIEPFVVMSMCFMTLFLKQISNDFEGTPIVVLYGEAASGKSNLLRLIANAFGLDKSVLHGGMDTVAGIIEDLENYVNIPLLVDEVEIDGIDAIKRLVKSVYGQTGRKKYSGKNSINTTLFFNTNHEFLYELEYKNFDNREAEKFNHLQKYLSFVSSYIIENINYSTIRTMIKKEEESELLSSVTDNRIKRNLSIAITGLKLMIELVNTESIKFENYKERIKLFIDSVMSIHEDEVSQFITVLKELLNDKYSKLEKNADYKITRDGLHLQMGKYAKTLETQLQIKFKNQRKGIRPLKLKQYQELLLKQGAEMNSVHYSVTLGSRYGLFLPYDKFDDLRYLVDKLEYSEQQSIFLEKAINNSQPF